MTMIGDVSHSPSTDWPTTGRITRYHRSALEPFNGSGAEGALKKLKVEVKVT